GPKHKNATALGKPDRFASFAMNPHSTRQPSASIPAGKRRAEHYCPRPLFGFPNVRLPAIALLACMMLPYAWVVRYEELDRILPALISMFPGMPTFYPAAIVGGLLGQPFHDSGWIAMLLTAAELTVGIWLIRLGPKRAIAFTPFAFLTATIGSLAFYQLGIS
ncbi:MAG: hypothetical protein NXI28_26620, partial [bacterium]|nr:hypothetical protein [bacterium]